MKRPAELAGAAGTIAVLVGRIAGITDVDTLTYIAAGIGLIPGAVTTLVAAGGIRGLARKVWSGAAR